MGRVVQSAFSIHTGIVCGCPALSKDHGIRQGWTACLHTYALDTQLTLDRYIGLIQLVS